MQFEPMKSGQPLDKMAGSNVSFASVVKFHFGGSEDCFQCQQHKIVTGQTNFFIITYSMFLQLFPKN